MGDEAVPTDGKKIVMSFPIIKECDMIEDMRNEVIDLCTSTVEKYPTNNETAAKVIKDTLDKKFGPPWQVVVGEGYGFVIVAEERSLMYMFFNGNCGIIVWKCT